MELHQLRYFLAVVEEDSFTRAAAKVGITQPSLSQQIGKLEGELQVPLFNRLGRQIEVTAAGRELIPRAQEVLNAVSDIASIIPAASGQASGSLIVGTVPTISQFLLPPIVGEYLIDYPAVDLVIHEDNRRQLVEQLRSGAIDLAFLSRMVDDPQLRFQKLFNEDFVLIMPPAHRLARRKQVRIGDLASERFVLLDQGANQPNLILDFCRGHGFEPTVACRTTQLSTVQSMVSAGLGIAFVPAMATGGDSDVGPVHKILNGPKPRRTLTMGWHRKRVQSRAALMFIEQVRRAMNIIR